MKQHVSSSSLDTATLKLLANWRRQDETTDPEQLRAAENELERFKKAMHDNRVIAGEPPPYP